MTRIDEKFSDGVRIWFQQWPEDPDGLMNENGTLRPLTEAEKEALVAEAAPTPEEQLAAWEAFMTAFAETSTPQ